MEGRQVLQGAGCELSVVTLGDPANPPLVLLHGMRDHALAMLPLAQPFANDYFVVLPDLRGHGDSDNPGSYNLLEFVADLDAVCRHFGLDSFVLAGHSLGGHIASRFSSCFPERVMALLLLDGMGPPRSGETTSAGLQARQQGQVAQLHQLAAEPRAMRDPEEALSRLRRNNPRLAEHDARRIVAQGIRPAGKGVTWKWDPRIVKIWGTFSHDESEMLYASIACPVLTVTGDEAHVYWRSQGLDADAPLELYTQENQRRLTLFANARHVEIADAGHMLHYDAPGATVAAMQDFLATATDG